VPIQVVKVALAKRSRHAAEALKRAKQLGKLVLEEGKLVAKDIQIPLPFTNASVAADEDFIKEEEDEDFIKEEEAGEREQSDVDLEGLGLENDEKALLEKKQPIEGQTPLERLIQRRFVPLEKILPPLPKRGSFDVNEIKVRNSRFDSQQLVLTLSFSPTALVVLLLLEARALDTTPTIHRCIKESRLLTACINIILISSSKRE
jgi:hypothetical protein